MARLTLIEIADRTGIHLATIKRWIKIDEVRKFMGAAGTPPTYPEECLPFFHKLKELHDAGDVRMKNIARTGLSLLQDGADSEVQNPNSVPPTLVPDTKVQPAPPSIDRQELLAGMQQAFLSALEEHHRLHPPEPFLSRHEAATLLKCHPANIRRLTGIVPIRRGVYLRSDIDQYVQRLTAQRDQQRVIAANPLPQIAPPDAPGAEPDTDRPPDTSQ